MEQVLGKASRLTTTKEEMGKMRSKDMYTRYA